MDPTKRKLAIMAALEDDSDTDEELSIVNLLGLADDCDEEVILQFIPTERRKRNCIKDYIEKVLPSYSEYEFRTHFRITRPLFNSLCEKFASHALYSDLREDKRFSADKNLLLFLWFAGHEACSFRDIADRFDMSISSVNRVISRVTMFLSGLCDEVFIWPNERRKEEISTYFKNKNGFPKVIGAIDGTHIRIDPPAKNKDDYIDRTGDVSICMQAICDHEGKFMDIFVGFPGSTHDSRVFNNSFIFKKLDRLCNGYFILGDSAYSCQRSLLTPYRNNGRLTKAQKLYNKKLSSCRVVIEHSFGMLKQRFRQLYYCKLRGLEKICHFVRACCVLHNLANRTDLDFIEENEVSSDLDSELAEDSSLAKAIRDTICQELQN